MIVFNGIIPIGKHADAMAMWPFILVRKGRRWNSYVERHERIHLAQQKELLLVGFYILYAVMWLFRGDDNAFEREAYHGQWEEDYLQTRKHLAWLNYIKNK